MLLPRPVGVVLAVAIGLTPLAPPEHVHERDEHGHHHAVVHRHSQPHHVAHPSGGNDGLFDDDDGPALTLTAVFAAPAAPARLAAPPSTPFEFVEPPARGSVHRAAAYVELLIHGPPRAPSSPRAPPTSAFL